MTAPQAMGAVTSLVSSCWPVGNLGAWQEEEEEEEQQQTLSIRDYRSVRCHTLESSVPQSSSKCCISKGSGI